MFIVPKNDNVVIYLPSSPPLSFTEEIQSYMFGMTWRWVNEEHVNTLDFIPIYDKKTCIFVCIDTSWNTFYVWKN